MYMFISSGLVKFLNYFIVCFYRFVMSNDLIHGL